MTIYLKIQKTLLVSLVYIGNKKDDDEDDFQGFIFGGSNSNKMTNKGNEGVNFDVNKNKIVENSKNDFPFDDFGNVFGFNSNVNSNNTNNNNNINSSINQNENHIKQNKLKNSDLNEIDFFATTNTNNLNTNQNNSSSKNNIVINNIKNKSDVNSNSIKNSSNSNPNVVTNEINKDIYSFFD